MNRPTLLSFYSGGGLVEAGLRGLVEPIGAVEYDPAIADVYRANHGDHVCVARVEDLTPAAFDRPDMLWLSPPCQEHSAARNKALGSRDDADAGLAVLPFLRAWQPPFVFVENVEGYKRARSFKAIIHTLAELGYWYDVQVLNAADYGVPQTRRRLIVRACRDGMMPQLPQPQPWIGWYAAIEDLIPTLPESEFAEWQLKRLPEQWRSFMHPYTTADGTTPPRLDDEPAFTITSTVGKNMPRAFLVGGANTSAAQAAPGVGVSDAAEPARCVNASNSSHWRAFLVDGKPGDSGSYVAVRNDGEPVFTVVASSGHKQPIRAWLEQGRVVKMTPRALGRFMTLPDWYQLPAQNSLATKIIGNGVPSRFARQIVAVTCGLPLGDLT